MTVKKFDQHKLQQRVDVLDAFARSGLSAQAFAQAQGLSYGQLRGWLAHGPRWRAQLAGAVYTPPVRTRAGQASDFVQLKVQAGRTPGDSPEATPSVRIDCSTGGRHAVLHWPVGAPLQCAQWLKAYLA